jgi:hypothetical protein
VAAGDRLFESHGKWMTGHSRHSATAPLDDGISQGPELSNTVDPDSDPTGDTIFVLDEFYESPTGVAERWRLPGDNWQDLSAFMDWTGKAKKVVTLHSGTVVLGLWQRNGLAADIARQHGRAPAGVVNAYGGVPDGDRLLRRGGGRR